MFRSEAAGTRQANPNEMLPVSVSQRPQLLKARRFGVARDSLFTRDSKRRFRLEAQCPFPI
jgi:hypothetical protein